MAQEIIDLDVLLAEPKKLRAGGKVYKLPPDIPVPLYLKMVNGALENLNGAAIEELADDVLELFREHQPNMTIDDLPLSLMQLIVLIPRTYMQTGDDSGKLPKKAAKGSPAGTRSTRNKR